MRMPGIGNVLMLILAVVLELAPTGVGTAVTSLSHFGKGEVLAFQATALASVGIDMLPSLQVLSEFTPTCI